MYVTEMLSINLQLMNVGSHEMNYTPDALSLFCVLNQFSLHLDYQIHTQLSKCPFCGIAHINTFGYGLSEHKQVGETGYVSVYYIDAFGLKGTAA